MQIIRIIFTLLAIAGAGTSVIMAGYEIQRILRPANGEDRNETRAILYVLATLLFLMLGLVVWL